MVNLKKTIEKVKVTNILVEELLCNLSLLSASSQNHSSVNVTCIVEFLLHGHPETVAVRIAVLFLSVKGGRPVLGAHHPDVVKSLGQHHYHWHLNESVMMVCFHKTLTATFSCHTIAQKSTRVESMVPWVTM